MELSHHHKQCGKKNCTFIQAVIVLIISIFIVLYGIVWLKLSPQIPLLCTALFGMLFSLYLRIPWKEIETKVVSILSESIVPMMIILLIGMLVGAWIACGTVPYIIYYGLKYISPDWFVVSAFAICSIMSVTSGSSWTTIGTIGVALMGVGYGLGVEPGMTAGAIICGAYFGNKFSPLSDMTNFVSGVTGVDNYSLVRSMAYTTLPLWLVCAGLFVFLGFSHSDSVVNNDAVNSITAGIEQAFNLSPIVLIPLIILVFLVIKRVPTIPSMIIAIAAGLVISIFIQKENPVQALSYLYSGFIGHTGISSVDSLLTRGGMESMMFTISLMFISLFMASILEETGVTVAIINRISHLVRSVTKLVGATVFSVAVLNFFAADPYLASLLPARSFLPAYDNQHIDRRVLGRSLQDGFLFCPLVPWGSNGIYIASVLGVSVLSYAPYYFLYLTPVLSILTAFFGLGIWYTNSPEGSTAQVSIKQ